MFTIDTGVLFPETYEAWRALERHYGLRVEVFDALREDGVPWSAARCCTERKVEALDAALERLDGWITGVRREQSPTRADAPKLSVRRRAAGSGRPTRSPTGTRSACGTTSRATMFPTTRCTTAATSRSAARPARGPGRGARGAGPAASETECGIHL